STTPLSPTPTPSATVSNPQEETIASVNVPTKVATSKKGKKHDGTWKFMRKFVNDQGEKKAECLICKKVLDADPKKNVTAQNVQSKRMVPLDCQTRWNSTFLMLDTMLDTTLVYEQVFTVLDAIDPTFKEDLVARKTSNGAPIGIPTTEDWKLVEKYWDESEGENVKMNKIFYIALLFDPRHKMQMLEHYFELMYGALRGQQLKMLVKEEIVKMFDMYRDLVLAREGEQVQGPAAPPMNIEEDEDCDDTFAGYDLQHKVIGNRAELDKYLDDACEGAKEVTEEFDILTWWKVVGAYKYPVMFEIAKDILAIHVSSVASESAFSNGGRVLDDFRSSLLPEIVKALICSEDWLRNPDDNGNDEEDEEDHIQFMEEIAALNISDSPLPPPLEDAVMTSASTIVRPIVDQFIKPTTSTGGSKLPTVLQATDKDDNESETGEEEDDYESEPCMEGAMEPLYGVLSLRE
ncbi:Zinc finger BED domain-containing protein RICESLEEPER 2, partial [Linum perenne]